MTGGFHSSMRQEEMDRVLAGPPRHHWATSALRAWLRWKQAGSAKTGRLKQTGRLGLRLAGMAA
jgi:hypothetical protein